MRTLGGGSPVSFVDMEFDHPGPRPSYGIAGYTSDGKSVMVQQRYDLWLLPLDGSAPRNLTNGTGTKNEIRFRYVRTEPPEQAGPVVPGSPGGGRGGGPAAQRWTIDLSKPVTLSAYGEYTKKAGFYELAGGQLKELVYEDAFFSTPTKAAKADKFLFTRETFVGVSRSSRLRSGLQGREEDLRRQSAAGGISLGSPHPVRLQEQGRPAAAGHPGPARRLQAGRKAADAREFLREKLTEPEPVLRAFVSVAAWDRRRSRP